MDIDFDVEVSKEERDLKTVADMKRKMESDREDLIKQNTKLKEANAKMLQ